MQRLIHIDLLKILCMYMIVIIHFYTHGLFSVFPNIDTSNNIMVLNFIVSELVLLVSSMAVNCFVMISGYFLIVKRPSIVRILSIWIETLFYSLLIAFIFYSLNPSDSNFIELVRSFTPIRNNEYWFVTKYIALMLLSPFLSHFAHSLTKKQYILLLFLLGLLCLNFFTTPALVKNIPLGDVYGGSTSLLWFVFLFFISGYVRLFQTDLKKWCKGKFFIISVIVFFMWTIFLEYLMYKQSGVLGHMGYMYNGILFFCSFFFFLYFISFQFRTNTILINLSKIVPYTFAVYLIHDHPCMDTLVWHTFVDWSKMFNSPFFIPFVFSFSLSIFLLCIFVSHLQKKIFMLLRINSLIMYVSNMIEKRLFCFFNELY